MHSIRSYEKLTAGGIRFFDTDLIGVLEKVLPVRFGGGPTDYQLVEDEAENGQPRLRLVVDPAVGTLDVRALGDAFLPRSARDREPSEWPASSGATRDSSRWSDAAPKRVRAARFSTSSPGGGLSVTQQRRSPGRAEREAQPTRSR